MLATQCKSIQSFQILRTNSPSQTLLIFEGTDWLMSQTPVTPFIVLNNNNNNNNNSNNNNNNTSTTTNNNHHHHHHQHCEMPSGLKQMFWLFFQDFRPRDRDFICTR